MRHEPGAHAAVAADRKRVRMRPRGATAMASVKVYQYDYYDGLLKRDRRSTDFATADAIMQIRATILSETERVIDEKLLQQDEHVNVADMPPRELPAQAHWMGDNYTTPPG